MIISPVPSLLDETLLVGDFVLGNTVTYIRSSCKQIDNPNNQSRLVLSLDTDIIVGIIISESHMVYVANLSDQNLKQYVKLSKFLLSISISLRRCFVKYRFVPIFIIIHTTSVDTAIDGCSTIFITHFQISMTF